VTRRYGDAGKRRQGDAVTARNAGKARQERNARRVGEEKWAKVIIKIQQNIASGINQNCGAEIFVDNSTTL
jgi:hypothetical protein